MTKNFTIIHENGVYRTRGEGDYIIVPMERRLGFQKNMKNFVAHSRETIERQHPGYCIYLSDGNIDDEDVGEEIMNSFEFVEYLGEWDWKKMELIPECVKFNKKTLATESADYFSDGIFRAKVTKRNCDIWVNFDSKGSFYDSVYGYTKNEFLELMPLLKHIELELIKENDN